MQVKALVKIINPREGGFHITFFRPVFSLFYAGINKEHTLSIASEFLIKQIESTGQDWIDSWSKSDSTINCPEGAIKLPADIWCCKLSKKECNLQASINLNNKKSFYKN